MRTSRYMPAGQVKWVAVQVARGCTYATIEERLGLPAGTLGQIVHHCRAGRFPWARPIVDAVDERGGFGMSSIRCDDGLTMQQAIAERERERIERRKVHPAKRDERAEPKPNPLAWTQEQIDAACEVMRAGGSRADAAQAASRSEASLARVLEKGARGHERFAVFRDAMEQGKQRRAESRNAALARVAARVRGGQLLGEACAAEGMSRSAALTNTDAAPDLAEALSSTRRERLQKAQRRAVPRVDVEATVYVIGAITRDGKIEAFKVGHTTQRIEHRRKKLQIGNPLQLVVLDTRPGTVSDEHDLHERLARYRIRGEWFAAEPEAMQIAGVTWKAS